MKLKIFTLPFDPETGFASDVLDEFCETRQVLEVREHWFHQEGTQWVAILVSYRERDQKAGEGGPRRSRDPRRDLDAADRAVYDALRDWRSIRSGADGVPPYLVFNNRQLAEIARKKPKTKEALAEIPGIGRGKLERYAEDVFTVLQQVGSEG